jgi:hypothetical protein
MDQRDRIARVINPDAFDEHLPLRWRESWQSLAYQKADGILKAMDDWADEAETVQSIHTVIQTWMEGDEDIATLAARIYVRFCAPREMPQ